MDNVVDLTEVFEEWKKDITKLDLSPRSPVVFNDDPVALSCAAYRLGGFPRLQEVVATDQDRLLAQQIRQHFLGKLTFQKLRGQHLSVFQEKLGAFLSGNKPLMDDELGILYRLPNFYAEDLEVQSLIESTDEVVPAPPEALEQTLKPYKNYVLHRRSGSIQQYWWTDSSRRPYCLSTKEKSESRALIQSIWEFKSIRVQAHMFTKRFNGSSRFYYKLVSPRLLSTE